MENRASIKCRLTTDRSTHVLARDLKGIPSNSNWHERGEFPGASEQEWHSTTQHLKEGGATLAWKGVIMCSELTLGRQMLEKQCKPRLLFEVCPHPLLCRTVCSKGQERIPVSVQVKHALLGGSYDRVPGYGNWGVGLGGSLPQQVSAGSCASGNRRLASCQPRSDGPHVEMKGQEKPLPLQMKCHQAHLGGPACGCWF